MHEYDDALKAVSERTILAAGKIELEPEHLWQIEDEMFGFAVERVGAVSWKHPEIISYITKAMLYIWQENYFRDVPIPIKSLLANTCIDVFGSEISGFAAYGSIRNNEYLWRMVREYPRAVDDDVVIRYFNNKIGAYRDALGTDSWTAIIGVTTISGYGDVNPMTNIPTVAKFWEENDDATLEALSTLMQEGVPYDAAVVAIESGIDKEFMKAMV